MNSNEQELEKAGYDNWKLSSHDDERIRIGGGGKWGTVEYVYMVGKIGKCPCCEEDVLEDELFVEENEIYHLSCYNYKKKHEKEEKGNGK